MIILALAPEFLPIITLPGIMSWLLGLPWSIKPKFPLPTLSLYVVPPSTIVGASSGPLSITPSIIVNFASVASATVSDTAGSGFSAELRYCVSLV